MSGDDKTTIEPASVAFRVTGGGELSAEDLAALTVALTPVGAPAARPSPRGGGWARAAIIEGIGGRPPASLPDLVQGRFGLGHVGDPRD